MKANWTPLHRLWMLLAQAVTVGAGRGRILAQGIEVRQHALLPVGDAVVHGGRSFPFNLSHGLLVGSFEPIVKPGVQARDA